MSVNAKQDPPWEHWKNPYLDDSGKEFCGHCGEDWPCSALTPRMIFEDPGAEHEIRLFVIGGDLGVACSCTGERYRPHSILEVRHSFPADEAMAVWKAHARSKGMKV